MGQQQLLLFVVTAVIVGIAMMVGVEAFRTGMVKSNEESVRKDIIEISSRIHQYYRTPEILGGGNYNFSSSLSFNNIGYFGDDVSGNTFENSNGTFTISVNGNTVTITGTGNEAGVSLTYTLTANTTIKKLVLTESTS